MKTHDTYRDDGEPVVLEGTLEENVAHYSEEGFWDKVGDSARKAGKKTLEPALKMYYSAQDPSTPLWAKTAIYGALGYFISPIDAIPDLTPLLGYTDDMSILAGALVIVAAKINDKHREKAKATLARWFG
ncbi:YkvA family protein [Billgrantia saliphila]|uniref:YkvA family protein n=1 Tax=Billgrantia saliphila TaxID=1848458 RepID=UPI000CE4E6B5|nr:YkvA family protein [Halomonas saliphila]